MSPNYRCVAPMGLMKGEDNSQGSRPGLYLYHPFGVLFLYVGLLAITVSCVIGQEATGVMYDA
jgi:hypothetical protein